MIISCIYRFDVKIRKNIHPCFFQAVLVCTTPQLSVTQGAPSGHQSYGGSAAQRAADALFRLSWGAQPVAVVTDVQNRSDVTSPGSRLLKYRGIWSFKGNTLPETNMAPENRPKRPKRKRESIPTIHLQLRKMVFFFSGRVCFSYFRGKSIKIHRFIRWFCWEGLFPPWRTKMLQPNCAKL